MQLRNDFMRLFPRKNKSSPLPLTPNNSHTSVYSNTPAPTNNPDISDNQYTERGFNALKARYSTLMDDYCPTHESDTALSKSPNDEFQLEANLISKINHFIQTCNQDGQSIMLQYFTKFIANQNTTITMDIKKITAAYHALNEYNPGSSYLKQAKQDVEFVIHYVVGQDTNLITNLMERFSFNNLNQSYPRI